jgi:hypothetical protein
MIKYILSFILASFLLSSVFAEGTNKKKPYIYDAGPAGEKSFHKGIKIPSGKMYTKENKAGWVKPPVYDFVRDDFSKSRNAFTIDGTAGKSFSFRTGIPSGTWYFTAWIESGFEDSSTTIISINNIIQDLKWQIFSPPSEPRTSIQKLYRVYSGKTEINDGCIIEFSSPGDSVRLLGFTLIPADEELNAEEESILKEIKEAGKYTSEKGLAAIYEKLQSILKHDPENSFAEYWSEQLNILMDGERLLDMMGWEWANTETGLGLFERYFQAVSLFDAAAGQEDNPLYERALWKRSKMLYWLNLEAGGYSEFEKSAVGLKELLSRYPDDKLLQMYNGVNVDTPDPCDSLKPAQGAPEWSRLQYEALCRLRQEIKWWVNVRQAANGEFGGKLGDDVEILRGWPAAVLAGDTTALYGWKKLADCIWESPNLYKGYSKKIYDVEHASEFISDSTPELVFFTDDDKYIDRLKFSADYFTNLWTGIAANGRRYFKSAWFSSTELDMTPPKNRDVEMNTRAAKAVRYYAWKTGDKETINSLHEWALAWAEVSNDTAKGKPAGIVPASVSFPDVKINGDEPAWYNANMYWDYFNWKHNAGTKMLDQFLFTYQLTGDTKLLEPLIKSLNLIKEYDGRAAGEPAEGSAAWAVEELRSSKSFWNSAEQYRFYSGDNSYNDLIMKYGTPYSQYRISGNVKFIEEALEKFLSEIRVNIPLRTQEVLHTDRVYYPGADYIKAMLTGDGTGEGTSPYYAVSWENTDSCFTALVDETGNQRLKVRIFSHADDPNTVTARLWQLKPGSYDLVLSSGGKEIDKKNINLTKRGERIQLSIPAKSLVILEINHK